MLKATLALVVYCQQAFRWDLFFEGSLKHIALFQKYTITLTLSVSSDHDLSLTSANPKCCNMNSRRLD